MINTNMSIPYTYFIYWSNLHVWYYGVRYARDCNPADLFVSYYTSSKVVKQLIKQYGNPDIIQVRRTFLSTKQAKSWEIKVLKRMKAVERVDCLNQHDKNAPPINRMFGTDNPQTRPEMKLRNSQRASERVQERISQGVSHVTGLPLQQAIEWNCVDCGKSKMYKPFELKHRQSNKQRCKSCAAKKRNVERWSDPNYKQRVSLSIKKSKIKS